VRVDVGVAVDVPTGRIAKPWLAPGSSAESDAAATATATIATPRGTSNILIRNDPNELDEGESAADTSEAYRDAERVSRTARQVSVIALLATVAWRNSRQASGRMCCRGDNGPTSGAAMR